MLAPGAIDCGLTAREREVLDCVMTGASSKEIAHQLGISVRTVEIHRFRIKLKLGARNTVDLVLMVERSRRG